MTWTVTKEDGVVSFSSWLAQEAATVEAEQQALRQAFRLHPPLSLKPPRRDEPDPFLSEWPWPTGAASAEGGVPGSGAPHWHAGQDIEALQQRIGAMAHEFSNLFTVVIGNLELVEAALHGNAKAEDRAADAVAAAQRGAQLTRRLMALARGQPVPVEVVDDTQPMAADQPRSLTVLVVDNDAAMRATAVGCLREFGYQVVEAGDAVEALKVLQDSEAINVLFTDVALPGPMNGFDLSQAASLIRPELAIIHASGHPKGSPVYDDEPRLSENLIAKPYGREQLRRIFAATLAGKRQDAKAG